MSLSTKKVILDEDTEGNAKAMDRLCLALALLTNLLQELSTMAFTLQEISEFNLLAWEGSRSS